jgi:DNA-binding HxlR family transcriptional regulator
MNRTRFDSWPCSVARSVDLVGDCWSPLILREAFYGERRFEGFLASLGLGRNVLAERLARLTEGGLLKRVPYTERPPRFEYRLTPMGKDFFPVMMALMQWGDTWLSKGKGAPIEVVDRTSGAVVSARVVDARSGKLLTLREVRARPGPGFPKKYKTAKVLARFRVRG